jgi:hypothetical protein
MRGRFDLQQAYVEDYKFWPGNQFSVAELSRSDQGPAAICDVCTVERLGKRSTCTESASPR